MLVHNVLFWLKEDLSESQLQNFKSGLESLKLIDSESCFIGTPAITDRPAIDRSYSFCLTVIFADMVAHDAYQVHPLHKDFLNKFNTFWNKVLIYDAD